MDQIILQRQSVKDFWTAHGEEMKSVASIDAVYKRYEQYVIDQKLVDLRRVPNPETKKLQKDVMISVGFLPPINRYIFRTLIRKMGYKNAQPKKRKLESKAIDQPTSDRLQKLP